MEQTYKIFSVSENLIQKELKLVPRTNRIEISAIFRALANSMFGQNDFLEVADPTSPTGFYIKKHNVNLGVTK